MATRPRTHGFWRGALVGLVLAVAAGLALAWAFPPAPSTPPQVTPAAVAPAPEPPEAVGEPAAPPRQEATPAPAAGPPNAAAPTPEAAPRVPPEAPEAPAN